jgi:anhydro-N-acetylmuramic acid kinase
MNRPEYYLGVMTGTSLDGLDIVLADFQGPRPRIEASAAVAFEPALRDALLALCSPGPGEIDRLGDADEALADAIAEACLALLDSCAVPPSAVRALGSHGQTVRHRPDAPRPFTLQIGDPHRIAERTGIAVVADFRRRDMAAGGQGAPLVPAFHRALLSPVEDPQAVLNLGGMANLTLLPGDAAETTGFDTGPGNTLLDQWHQKHRGVPVDRNGAWGASGTVQPALLEAFLADPFFQRAPPKSTGRERFNLPWLERFAPDRWPPADVQATLGALTAASVADALARFADPTPKTLWLAGGGRHNRTLVAGLTQRLSPGIQVKPVEAAGFDGDQLEALAFAWLAAAHCRGMPGNVPAVTGARGPRVLGAYFPA